MKKKDDNISYTKLFKNVLLLIVGGILGLFFPFVARIFISYYVLLFSIEFISELHPKKEAEKWRGWAFYLYLVGAIFISLVYHNYIGKDTNIFSNEKRINKINNENLKEELNTQKTFDGAFPQESVSIKKPNNLKSKNINEVKDKSKEETPKQTQKTGEIKF